MNENNNPPQSPKTVKAREFVVDLLERLGVRADVEEGVMGDSPTLSIRTHEANLLIGDDGQRLEAINHLLRRVLEKGSEEGQTRILVDVNDYHRRRYDELRDNARMGAQRVRYFKKEVELSPMNAFDRRIIHLTLQEYPDITTESVGIGKERRVVIRLYIETSPT